MVNHLVVYWDLNILLIKANNKGPSLTSKNEATNRMKWRCGLPNLTKSALQQNNVFSSCGKSL